MDLIEWNFLQKKKRNWCSNNKLPIYKRLTVSQPTVCYLQCLKTINLFVLYIQIKTHLGLSLRFFVATVVDVTVTCFSVSVNSPLVGEGFLRLNATLLKQVSFRLSLLDNLLLFLLKRSCSSRRASCASSRLLAICNSSRKTSLTLTSNLAEASKNLQPLIDSSVVSSAVFVDTWRWVSRSLLLPTRTTGTCGPKRTECGELNKEDVLQM